MSSPSKTSSSSSTTTINDDNGLRKGTWTVEEDSLLVHFIALHGEGRWNLLAVRSGLRRTGKSCRLRWLNYLKPDVKRGNLSPQEQLLILDLHSRWGSRWSKIAQQLPGRTDNEIKNYWRTRVQKQAKLLNMDSNSPKFQDIVRYFWIPRLLHQINNSPSSSPSSSSSSSLNSAQNQPVLQHSESEVPADEKRCRFASEKSNELNLDPPCQDQYFIGSSGSDPLSDDMKSHILTAPAAGELGFPAADFQSELYSDWMDDGCFWNFDELWQF